MTAAVVSLDDHRRTRTARAAQSIPLVAVGNGRTAHAVDQPRTLAILAVSNRRYPAAAVTLCGRDAYGDLLAADAPLCRACARKLTTRPAAAGTVARLDDHRPHPATDTHAVARGGTVAHTVAWTLHVPDVPDYGVTAHLAVYTHCGRALDARDLIHAPLTPPCRRCTRTR